MSSPEPRDLVRRPDPPPGLTRLRRRMADRLDFRDALLAALAEVPEPDGTPLGSRLDVAGDPAVVMVAELWSRVCDSVAAYTELAAGEHYLGTAQDWTDLRRTADLLGHRPTQRAAAHGWIRCTTDTAASPLVPAGTRVQSPGTPARAAQTFEVAADTQLRADWANLTVTAVPVPQPPPHRSLRLLADPGFAASDRVVLVAERPTHPVYQPVSWWEWLPWLFGQDEFEGGAADAARAVVGTVKVTKRSDDLGAFLITTDRSLHKLLATQPGTTYAAYRVRATLALAHRLDELSYIDANHHAATAAVTYGFEPASVTATRLLVVDASAASPGLGVIISNGSGALVTTVVAVGSLDWSVAPGTKQKVGWITLADSLTGDLVKTDIDIVLVDDRVVAQNYELPALTAGQTRLRVHPRPAVVPDQLAVQTTTGWQLATCTIDADDTVADTGGMLLVLGAGFTGIADHAPGTANLVPIQHGATSRGPLTLSASTVVIAGPVTGDIDASGRVTDSLSVRVAGLEFDEVDSLYARGPGEAVFTSRLAADGRMVLTFGDGVNGALPRGDVTAQWRVGGGLDGEMDAGLIDTLLTSVRGVRKIAGVGSTTGAADQEDPLRMRRAAAARIRALDRGVSLADLADLALTVPGTSHSAAWRGAGPPGCPCGGVGLHLASLRLTQSGVRPPQPAELVSLAGYLDARRDTSVGVCVCAGVSSALPLSLTIATDPRRDSSTVHDAVVSALADAGGALAPRPRDLGLPMDASDVISVAQPVLGVVGVVSLSISPGVRAPSPGEVAIGRTPAERYELLSAGSVTVVVA